MSQGKPWEDTFEPDLEGQEVDSIPESEEREIKQERNLREIQHPQNSQAWGPLYGAQGTPDIQAAGPALLQAKS